MQLDAGSPVSVITWPTCMQHKAAWPSLQDSPLRLTCFLGKLLVRGPLKLKLALGDESREGTLTVLGCSEPNLFGRDLIRAFDLLEMPVLSVATEGELSASSFVDKVTLKGSLDEFAEVFETGLGLIQGPPAHLQLRADAAPKFCKARQVPYALRSKIEAEIDQLVETGVIIPAPHSE